MKSISDHLLDIIQNSVRAESTLIEIIVVENKLNNIYTLTIKDNGCGMNTETLEKASNPFFTSRKTRKVGLGLSLLKQNAEAANGNFVIKSATGKGTEVHAVFELNHLDRPPVGDIWNSWYLSVIGNPNIRIDYKHHTDEGIFEINSDSIREIFDNIPLQQADLREAIIEMIKNNLEEIKASR